MDKLPFEIWEDCLDCNGTGQIRIGPGEWRRCGFCDGEGGWYSDEFKYLVRSIISLIRSQPTMIKPLLQDLLEQEGFTRGITIKMEDNDGD